MALTAEQQALFDHARRSLPRWLTRGKTAVLEWLHADTQVMDSARQQGQDWLDITYLDNAEGAELDQHALDRGTTRRSGEDDDTLRERLRNITDVVTDPALTTGINAILAGSGLVTIPGTPGLSFSLDGGLALPATSAQWTELLTGTGLLNPTSLWLFQETSGNLIDQIGSNDLTPAGSPTYQQVATGMTRKGITFDEGSTDSFSGTCVPSSQNYNMMVVFRYTGNPGAAHSIVEHPNIFMESKPGHILRANANSQVDGTVDYGETFHVAFLQNDSSDGDNQIITSDEVISPTMGSFPGTTISIGGAVGTAAGMEVVYACAWEDISLNTTEIQTIIDKVENSVAAVPASEGECAIVTLRRDKAFCQVSPLGTGTVDLLQGGDASKYLRIQGPAGCVVQIVNAGSGVAEALVTDTPTLVKVRVNYTPMDFTADSNWTSVEALFATSTNVTVVANTTTGGAVNSGDVQALTISPTGDTSAESFLSRGYRMTYPQTPMEYIVILPYGTTPAMGEAVAEYLRQYGPAGFAYIIEIRANP